MRVALLAVFLFSGFVFAQESVLHLQEQLKSPGFFGKQGSISQVETWIGNHKIKKDEQDQNRTLLMRSDVGTVWRINHSDSTYQEIPLEVFQGMSLMGMMVFGVTTDSLTGEPIIPDPLFTKTSRYRKIGMWQAFEMVPAQKGEGSFASKVKSFSIWVSPECGISPQVYASLARDMMGPLASQYKSIFTQLEQLEGYPVLIETTTMGKSAEQRLLFFEEETVPAHFFDLPKGYQLIDSDLFDH